MCTFELFGFFTLEIRTSSHVHPIAKCNWCKWTQGCCAWPRKKKVLFLSRPHQDTNEVWKYPCLGTHEACPNKEAHGIQLTLTFKPKHDCTHSSCLSWKVSHVLVVAYNRPIHRCSDLQQAYTSGGFLKNSVNIVTDTVRLHKHACA